MRSYYVLTAPAAADVDRDTKFIRDGFSWFAFVLPLPWLLVKRLWLVFAAAIIVYIATILIAEEYRLDGLPIAFGFVLSLWTALEGGNAQVRALERRGWQVERVIAADRLSDAEEIYFADKATTGSHRAERPLPPMPARKAIAASDAVALGLIGPAGGTLMRVAIIDYGSGNLRSAVKAFERAARESGLDAEIELTDKAERVATADRIVLPGVGAYADCRRGLDAVAGMVEALRDVVEKRARPFLGICVGMQLMSSRGLEKTITEGLGWIEGDVKLITPDDPSLKIPQIGWNTLELPAPHALFADIPTGETGLHAYFVHSYHLSARNPEDLVATADYAGSVTAFVARANMAGAQFHPEKSQTLGLRLIGNFLKWAP